MRANANCALCLCCNSKNTKHIIYFEAYETRVECIVAKYFHDFIFYVAKCVSTAAGIFISKSLI